MFGFISTKQWYGDTGHYVPGTLMVKQLCVLLHSRTYVVLTRVHEVVDVRTGFSEVWAYFQAINTVQMW